MARMDPNAAASKYVRNTAAATGAYKDGINSVTEAPGQRAAAQAAVAAANYADAINSGRWAQRVASVSLPAWKDAALNKGASRYSSGTAAAQPKVLAAMQRLFPRIQAAMSSLPPRGDVNANLERARQFALSMHQSRGQ